MEVILNPWSILLLIGSVQAGFLSFVFFRKSFNWMTGPFIFGFLLLCLSVLMLDHSARLSRLNEVMPWVLYLSDPFWFLIGPLIFLFIKVNLSKKIKWFDYLHFIPFLFFLYLFFPLMLARGEIKSNVLNAYIEGGSVHSFEIKLIILFMMIQMLVYFLYSVIYLKNYEGKFKDQFSDNDINLIQKLRLIVIFFLLYFSFEFTFSTYRNFMNIQNRFIENWSLVVWIIFVLTVAYNVIQKPFLIDYRLPNEKRGYEKEIGQKNKAIVQNLLQLMEEKRLFLKKDLSLNDLAEELNMSTHQLSYIINNQLNVNFYEFVNNYRVKAVEKELRNGNYKTYNIFGIAQSKGFKSKASFYRFFKKEFRQTPLAYIKSQKLSDNN